MTSVEVPEIAITLSLSPTTYRFSDATAPELTVTATSDIEKPFTVFCYGTVLDPRNGLQRHRFTITDLTAGVDLPQILTPSYRIRPFDRIRGSASEWYFPTIEPGTLVNVSTRFGPGAIPGGIKEPQSKATINATRPDDMNETGIVVVHGVHSLEPGHRYRLSMAMEDIQRRAWWWRWRRKDDFSVDRDHPDPWLKDKLFEPAQLRFKEIEGLEFTVEDG
ncbi:MAG: hypothetical protein LQ350_006950 [Teloschistes chrysophthalmus]|nr:MAG: hypothetical protein LQ350_006950 [Niorma chrysophthalma]